MARQSMQRTSSPSTYSRSESNSVPWPADPDRGAAVELAQPGQPDGQVLAGVERRQRPAPSAARERAPAGRPGRAGRCSARSPGRRAGRRGAGQQGGGQHGAAAGGRSRRCRLPVAPAEGCHASRSSPRHRRRPGVGDRERRLGRLAQPDRRRSGARRRDRAAAATRRAASRAATSSSDQQQPAGHDRAGSAGRSTTGTTPSSEQERDAAGDRHRRRLIAGPAPSRARDASTCVDGDALELGLGPQPEPVAQGRRAPAP